MLKDFDRSFWIVEGALIAAFVVLLLLSLSCSARAHDAPAGWKYPWACCSNMDCKRVDGAAVTERPEGYVIQSTGEVVAYRDKRVRNSPDGDFHWCAHQAGLDAGHTICLFVPPKGTFYEERTHGTSYTFPRPNRPLPAYRSGLRGHQSAAPGGG